MGSSRVNEIKYYRYIFFISLVFVVLNGLFQTPFLFKTRGIDDGIKVDLNGNKGRSGLYSRGSSPYHEQILNQYDNANANTVRPSSNIYIPSSNEMKINSRLSPLQKTSHLRGFNTDVPYTKKDGRENSEKMIESWKDTSLSDLCRAPADGSSRQNSFCLQTDDMSAERNIIDQDNTASNENVQRLASQYKELERSNKFEGVRSERLEEHVKVLNRNIKSLETKLEQTGTELKKERVKAARLEKSLEKAQIGITCIHAPLNCNNVDLNKLSNNILRKTNYGNSEPNQENVILGANVASDERNEHSSSKGKYRNTPRKNKLERQSSLKYFTEKGPTIYIV